jgi:hypothetical protein
LEHLRCLKSGYFIALLCRGNSATYLLLAHPPRDRGRGPPFRCQREHLGVAYSPMASGLLMGAVTPERNARLPDDNWRKGHGDFREPQLSHSLELVSPLRRVSSRHGRSPGEAAVAWVLRDSVVTLSSARILGTVIPRTRSRRGNQSSGYASSGRWVTESMIEECLSHLRTVGYLRQ